MPVVVGPVSSQPLAVTGTSGHFAAAMEPGCQYEFICEVDCWITVGASGAAAQLDTNGSVFVNAGSRIPLANMEDSGKTNSFVHAIAQGLSGDATLTQYRQRLA